MWFHATFVMNSLIAATLRWSNYVYLQRFAIYLHCWVTRHFFVLFCYQISNNSRSTFVGVAWHEMKVNLLFFPVVTPRWVQSSVTKMPERLFGLYSAQIFGTTFIELPKESKRQFNRQYRRPWRRTLCTRTEYHIVAVGAARGNQTAASFDRRCWFAEKSIRRTIRDPCHRLRCTSQQIRRYFTAMQGKHKLFLVLLFRSLNLDFFINFDEFYLYYHFLVSCNFDWFYPFWRSDLWHRTKIHWNK